MSIGLVLSAVWGTAQNKETKIEDVIIQGKFLETPYHKVNENIIVITKKDIENAPARSIDEVLQQFAGLDIRRRGANGVQSDISIRGGSFDQTMVLINGIRMNDSQSGHNTLNIPIDLSNVERIEVIKGSASMRFGNNAYAGVINIITKTSSEEEVRISAEGGDFSTYDLGLSATFGGEKFSNFFQANSGASQGYRYNTDYKINNVFYQGQYLINDGKINFQAGFSEKKFGANGFYASPKATEQYEEVQASVVSVAFQKKMGQWGLNSNAYWRRGQDMYLFNRNNPAIYRNHHLGNNIGGEVNASYQSSLGTTGVGVELRKEYLVSYNNRPANSMGDRDRFVTQFFANHHFSLLNNRLQITPGISWSNISTAGNFFYPGLDVGFSVNDHHKIYGSVSKVNRIPSFTDLYYVSGTEVGNANLKPESAISSEVGYRYQRNSVEAKLTAFMRNSNDAIDWVKHNVNDKWEAQNIGQMNLKGVEVEVKQHLADWVSYSLGYTYIDNKRELSKDILSKYALENLKHQFVAKLENRFLKHFSNELVYRYNERLGAGSYNLLDEKLSYNAPQFSVYVLINNLTNTQYSEMSEPVQVPMPGRWFHIGFSWKVKFN